ncbi:MAG TPA: polyribonucleotide nucleotidyltransferase [Helicobacteraceae bacterium]|nr:polyribonucleotide nucleotidyltransferase [Helicobacteraceae bacterium]
MSTVKISLPGEEQLFSFNKVAKQSNGAVWLECGKSVLLATVVMDELHEVQEEFLPLTVQYIEKSYAAGKIPGGFIKRETKPSDFETLTSRIIDRSLRPLFEKGFNHAIQITVMVLSADENSDLQRLALNAASAALYVSDLPITTSITGVRAAIIEDELVLNPSLSELEESTLDLFVSGSKDDLVMIEMQSISSTTVDEEDIVLVDPMIDPSLNMQNMVRVENNALEETRYIEILQHIQQRLNEQNSHYEETFLPHAKPKQALVHASDETMRGFTLQEKHIAAIEHAIVKMAKSERNSELQQLIQQIHAEDTSLNRDDIAVVVYNKKQALVRQNILAGKRPDSRGLLDIREISIETNLLPNVHASSLFTRGQTQALVALTIGGIKDAQMYENLTDSETQNETFMVHYNFPGFSVGEASPIGPVRRRELGHGNLAKRALESSCIAEGRTIRLVSEILESNGSSSMATVCGGYMALRAADIEMVEPIAGIAMGLIKEDDQYAILSDISGLEDHDGDMDFKIAGSKRGITAMQMDIKLGGIDIALLKEALMQAKTSRSEIIDKMQEAESQIALNDGTLPTSDFFHIDPDAISEVIGQAGKTIREIIEKFEVAIDINKKEGGVKVTGTSKQNISDARKHIESISNEKSSNKVEYHVGDRVTGKVKKIVDFGAFIELPGGVDGLLHISKLSKERVNAVSDVLSLDQSVEVEILEFKGNKISLALID